MKIFAHLVLLLICLSCQFTLMSQQKSFLLDGNQKFAISGFISLDQEFSSYDKKFAASTGASFGILFNQQLYVGAFGSGMISPGLELINDEFDEFYPGFGHGGLMIGGIMATDKLLHLDLNAKFGFGGHKISEDNFPHDPDYDAVFTITPSVSAELNVAPFFKVKAGVGYRYVSGFQEGTANKNILNSPTGSVSLIFGWFGQGRKNRVEVEPINDDQIRL